MMVLAAAVRAESSFAFFRVLFFRGFCHCDHPSLWKIRQHYLKESSAAQVPGKIVLRASLQQKNGKTEMENIAGVGRAGITRQSDGPASDGTLVRPILTIVNAPASNRAWISSALSRATNRPICPKKSVLATKHFPALYVFTGEEGDKLNVAEKPNDDHREQTTAPDGRSAKPFAGTTR